MIEKLKQGMAEWAANFRRMPDWVIFSVIGVAAVLWFRPLQVENIISKVNTVTIGVCLGMLADKLANSHWTFDTEWRQIARGFIRLGYVAGICYAYSVAV